jgi:hypothetical protein
MVYREPSCKSCSTTFKWPLGQLYIYINIYIYLSISRHSHWTLPHRRFLTVCQRTSVNTNPAACGKHAASCFSKQLVIDANSSILPSFVRHLSGSSYPAAQLWWIRTLGLLRIVEVQHHAHHFHMHVYIYMYVYVYIYVYIYTYIIYIIYIIVIYSISVHVLFQQTSLRVMSLFVLDASQQRSQHLKFSEANSVLCFEILW